MRCTQFGWGWFSVGTIAWFLTIGTTGVLADPIVIDDFELPSVEEVFFIQGPNAMNPTNTALFKHSDTTGGIIGGQRDVWVQVGEDAQPLSASGIIGLYYEVDEELVGLLSIATFGEPGSQVMLQYDGRDEFDSALGGLDNAHGLTVDLTDGGTNRGFVLSFLSSDGVQAEGLDLRITATGADPDGVLQTLTYTGYVPDGKDPFEYSVPFSAFTSTGLASFSNIDSLTFTLNEDGAAFGGDGRSTPNVDFDLDSITVVPEPSTWALLGLAVLASLAGERRRRKQ